MRIAIGLEYNGSCFRGWQSQAQGATVQDAVERALAEIAGHPVRTHAAGRTDAGVHALMQVVHFDAEQPRPQNAWIRGVNAVLPSSIAVRWASEVDDDFHARFSAVARSYRYVLFNHPVRPALDAGHVGWFHRPLELEPMVAAARFLLGEHDFSAFRSAECQAKSPVKNMQRAEVVRQGDLLIFDFRANAFLHHMVRSLVGALVYVGKGNFPPEWVGELLNSRDRTRGAPTFSAAGLYFAAAHYDPRWRLPDSARIIQPLSLSAI